MPYVVAGNVKLFFEENGYGYPIIFLHEFESDSHAWDSQIRHFARNYRCIAYNARGYPPSGVPNELASYGWELSVEDVAAVMRGLSIPRAHLLGSSMGGHAKYAAPFIKEQQRALRDRSSSDGLSLNHENRVINQEGQLNRNTYPSPD